jgi:polyisoprenoid-binding protein YceI
MGKILIWMVVSFSGIFQAKPVFIPNDSASSVKFVIKNFGLTVNGRLSGLEGKINFDPADLKKSLFDVTVEASTINTGMNARDNHLKKKEYLDVEVYPKIHIISTDILPGSKPGTYIARGKLTLKKTTKDIDIPFKVETLTSGGYKFIGGFTINRREFNVGSSSISLSDFLTVSLAIITK